MKLASNGQDVARRCVVSTIFIFSLQTPAARSGHRAGGDSGRARHAFPSKESRRRQPPLASAGSSPRDDGACVESRAFRRVKRGTEKRFPPFTGCAIGPPRRMGATIVSISLTSRRSRTATRAGASGSAPGRPGGTFAPLPGVGRGARACVPRVARPGRGPGAAARRGASRRRRIREERVWCELSGCGIREGSET